MWILYAITALFLAITLHSIIGAIICRICYHWKIEPIYEELRISTNLCFTENTFIILWPIVILIILSRYLWIFALYPAHLILKRKTRGERPQPGD